MMNGTIQISIKEYTEMLAAYASTRALERYVKVKKYDVSREEIAAILGFELEKGSRYADV